MFYVVYGDDKPYSNLYGYAKRRKSKPWWNPELTRLWKTARKAEKELYKAKRHGEITY